VKKGFGLDHDFLHLHYRSSPIMLSMGAEPIDSMRQMKNTVTDPYSGGRNFGNHYSKRDWNVVPVSSTIETQYLTAIGTAIGQTKKGCKGITIVNGGDSGTAEGDFASALVWASRPVMPLPMLMIVTNNGVGISTPHCNQFGGKSIAARGSAFEIKNQVINGNDVEESWFALQEAIAYVREERKPFLLEARVSRLYGHSSASGANNKHRRATRSARGRARVVASSMYNGGADCSESGALASAPATALAPGGRDILGFFKMLLSTL
jgi:2-oxoisovalerate dehydrogenase E1 component alpha subunit